MADEQLDVVEETENEDNNSYRFKYHANHVFI